MKRNHLFASAAVGAVLVVTLPVHAQVLGGGMHSGASSVQSARIAGGSGPMRSALSSQTNLSASARAGARVDGLGRIDQTAKTGTQEAGRDAGRAKADAAMGRGAMGVSESAKSGASDTAFGVTRAAAGATTATSVTAAGQSEARVRSVDTAGAVAGGLSTTEGLGTKAATGSAKPSPGDPLKPDTAGRSSQSSATPAPQPKSEGGTNGAETARNTGSQGEIGTNASTAVGASAR
jgi:trimeric autotransporter adhesin